MGDVVVLKAADDMDDGIDFADMAEKLVSQPFALAGAAHQTGDIGKIDLRRNNARRFGDLGQLEKPLVG